MAIAIVCFECKNEFAREDLVEIRGSLVCASCKPILLQKVEEYGSAIVTLMPAGFWIRFAALFLDGFVLMGVMAVFGGIAGVLVFAFKFSAGIFMFVGLSYYIIFPIYHIFCLGKYGATLGKKMVKIKVVRMDGSSFGYGLATGRFFAFVLGYFTICIGYIMAAFDEKYKRALHDRICNTRVVYVK